MLYEVITAIFSPITGKLSDRIVPRILASVGMAITGIGLFLFTFIQIDTNIYSIVLNLILVGLGFAIFSSPNTNAIVITSYSIHYTKLSEYLNAALYDFSVPDAITSPVCAIAAIS